MLYIWQLTTGNVRCAVRADAPLMAFNFLPLQSLLSFVRCQTVRTAWANLQTPGRAVALLAVSSVAGETRNVEVSEPYFSVDTRPLVRNACRTTRLHAAVNNALPALSDVW